MKTIKNWSIVLYPEVRGGDLKNNKLNLTIPFGYGGRGVRYEWPEGVPRYIDEAVKREIKKAVAVHEQ